MQGTRQRRRAFPPSVGASCSLGNGSADTVCSRSNSRHANLIETAINLLVQERPQIFDLKDVSAPNSDFYKVLDTEAYLDGLVTNLRRQGACAERDTDDAEFRRILVKTSNQFSETYEVLTPNGYVRRTDAGYQSTCDPASLQGPRGRVRVLHARLDAAGGARPRVLRYHRRAAAV